MTKQEFIAKAAPEIEAWFLTRYAGWIDNTKFSFDPADAGELASDLWDRALAGTTASRLDPTAELPE